MNRWIPEREFEFLSFGILVLTVLTVRGVILYSAMVISPDKLFHDRFFYECEMEIQHFYRPSLIVTDYRFNNRQMLFDIIIHTQGHVRNHRDS